MPPTTLAQYYRHLGLAEQSWHIGPEHPGLELFILRVLGNLAQSRTLEIGVQAGGLAVPLILGAADRPGFSYTGVDSLEYDNAVPLRLIADYLKQAGVTAPVRFIESDSTTVLRSESPSAYDLIVFDHYKPKYPIDLHIVLQHNILAAGGVIVLHDVLVAARTDWKVCESVCRAFGYTWSIDASVLQGVAVVRRSDRAMSGLHRSLVGLRVRARWHSHAIAQRVRHTIGNVLRAAGLR